MKHPIKDEKEHPVITQSELMIAEERALRVCRMIFSLFLI